MINLAMKNTVIKAITVIFLCFITIFLSAFTYSNETKYLSRLELAMLLEEILNDASIGINEVPNTSFNDFDQLQCKQIKKVLKYKIMNGYPDDTFRPNIPIRNLEVISYLQRLTEFLRNSNPESPITKRLFRFLSYSEDVSIALEYSSMSLPKSLECPNDFAVKELVSDLTEKLTLKNNNSKHKLTGQILDSLTGKPIINAFVSANEQATPVDSNGFFSFDLSKKTTKVNIFAAADDYQSIELKKDLNLSNNITIRLRPDILSEQE